MIRCFKYKHLKRKLNKNYKEAKTAMILSYKKHKHLKGKLTNYTTDVSKLGVMKNEKQTCKEKGNKPQMYAMILTHTTTLTRKKKKNLQSQFFAEKKASTPRFVTLT